MSLLAKKERISRIYAQCRDAAVALREAGKDHEAHQLERAGAQVDLTVKSLNRSGQDVYRLGAYASAVQLYKRFMGVYPENAKRLNPLTGDLEDYHG